MIFSAPFNGRIKNFYKGISFFILIPLFMEVVGCGSNNGNNINGSLSGTVVKGPLIESGKIQVYRFTSEDSDDLSPILEEMIEPDGKFWFFLGELSGTWR